MDLYENHSENSLKGDLSNDTTVNPPLFSLVNTFNLLVTSWFPPIPDHNQSVLREKWRELATRAASCQLITWRHVQLAVS
jgi:hypothetical protein